MKLVIDIPKRVYTWIQREWVECDFDSVINHALNGIKNGTPLETQLIEECEDNGSPWCLGHCPYRNTSQCPYEDTIHKEDAVSRSEVKDGMLKYGFKAPDMTVTEFVEDCLPSVTPQRPKGKWIKTAEGFSPYQCSECEKVEFKKSKFCPNCGAEMSEDCDKQNL